MSEMHGTTVLAVRKNGRVAMAGDGQVTMGDTVVKGNARKVRRIYSDKILVGFAGATADAFTLLERFEGKLSEYSGDVTRGAVELAKEWRTDRMLRRLEAVLLISDKDHMYLVSGTGDVVEPEAGAIAIGSGGNYALAAALAYLDADGQTDDLSAREIALRSLMIAGRICIYTNTEINVEELE